MAKTKGRWAHIFTSDDRAAIDAWGDGTAARTISAHLPFVDDQLVLEVPETVAKKVKPNPDVAAVLAIKGYIIKDWVAGTAIDPKYGRTVRIGAVLKDLNAQQSLIDKFNLDPGRSATKKGDRVVVICRHPYDVAAMSYKRGWSSCMDFRRGENRSFLKYDISEGTHVAYLTTRDDIELLQSPQSRIALKVWVAGDAEGRTTFGSPGWRGAVVRPETSVYGECPAVVRQLVDHWCQTNMPIGPHSYYKSRALYDDSGQRNEVLVDYSTVVGNDAVRLVGRWSAETACGHIPAASMDIRRECFRRWGNASTSMLVSLAQWGDDDLRMKILEMTKLRVVMVACAQYGGTAIHDELIRKLNTKKCNSPNTLMAVAQYGTDAHRTILAECSLAVVRQYVFQINPQNLAVAVRLLTDPQLSVAAHEVVERLARRNDSRSQAGAVLFDYAVAA